MKKNLSIILSIIALVGTISVWMLWICNVFDFSVISLDTFVGIMVALLGLSVTFAIGWQIVNALEIKNKLKEIEAIKTAVDEQRTLISELAWDTKKEAMFILGEECLQRKNYLDSFRFALTAVMFCLISEPSNNIEAILFLLEQAANNINQGSGINQTNHKTIIDADKAIRNSSKFMFVKSRYEKSFLQYIQKVSVYDE